MEIRTATNLHITSIDAQDDARRARAAAFNDTLIAHQEIEATPAQIEAIRPKSLLARLLGR